jgi:hypothetical protein
MTLASVGVDVGGAIIEEEEEEEAGDGDGDGDCEGVADRMRPEYLPSARTSNATSTIIPGVAPFRAVAGMYTADEGAGTDDIRLEGSGIGTGTGIGVGFTTQ